ncbi:AAA family ATPase [Streptomyces longwoodensis]|uniref:AAA family ATPase n=1 Tax=Streptomyces longwoodensis TaxID=68231 RepID=UPI003409A4FB
MTAPLTPPPPPHDPSSQGAWPPPPGPYGYGAQVPHDGGPQEPGLLTELRDAAVVTVLVTVLGVLLGLLWVWLAPRVPLVGDVVDGGWVVYLKDTEGEQAVGADGTFTLLGLGFGAVTAAAVFLWRRRGGVPLVVALALGGLFASLIAWRIGLWLGPTDDVLTHAKSVGKGVTFSAPLKLGAHGALLAWSMAAMVVHLGLTALFGPRDPELYGTPPAG